MSDEQADGALGRPRDDELLAAVRQFLAEEILPGLDGQLQHHLRVSLNVLGQLERASTRGSWLAQRHRRHLEAFGAEDDPALAAAIRRGELDDRPDLRSSLLRDTIDRLSVVNPDWLVPADRTETPSADEDG